MNQLTIKKIVHKFFLLKLTFSLKIHVYIYRGPLNTHLFDIQPLILNFEKVDICQAETSSSSTGCSGKIGFFSQFTATPTSPTSL